MTLSDKAVHKTERIEESGMAARISGGFVGWIAGVLPLAIVNVFEYFGIYYFDQPALAGAAALVGGIVLGGIVAGIIGGRARRNDPGGTVGALLSGGVAAFLYAVSLIAVLYIARSFDAPPPIIARHPVRISVAIIFFAVLLLGISVLTGALTGRRNAAPAYASASSIPQQHYTGMREPPISDRPLPRTSYPSDSIYGRESRDDWYDSSEGTRRSARQDSQPHGVRQTRDSREAWRQ